MKTQTALFHHDGQTHCLRALCRPRLATRARGTWTVRRAGCDGATGVDGHAPASRSPTIATPPITPRQHAIKQQQQIGHLGRRRRDLAALRRRNREKLARAASVGRALLLKVSGHDKPGISAMFTELLASTGCEFYDIDQPWTQPWCTNNLSLYFLAENAEEQSAGGLLHRSVLDKSQREFEVEFEVISNQDLVEYASALAQPQGLVVTLLKSTLGFKEISAVARHYRVAQFHDQQDQAALYATASDDVRRPARMRARHCAFHAMQNGEPTTAVSNVPNVSAVEFLVEPPQDAHIDPAVASVCVCEIALELNVCVCVCVCVCVLQRETVSGGRSAWSCSTWTRRLFSRR